MVRRLGVGLGTSTKKKHKVDGLLFEEEVDASKKGYVKEDDQFQHQRDGKERLPAETGGGGVPQSGPQKRR
jgi:hypothetical protein